MKPLRILLPCLIGFTSPSVLAAVKFVDLGGPATGYLAIANFKNGTQNSLEGKDANGNPDPSHNGLPDYPNYQKANGGHTAIIVSPQSASSDYSAFENFSSGTYGGNPIVVNNQTISDAGYSTMSAGLIGFDDSLLTGSGLETIPLSALTFNFDTYNWNGVTANGWDIGSGNINISPFSPIYTEYNDAGGAGNAAILYNLSLSNITGTGLTFVDGQLVSMDINATLNVLMRVGYFYVPLDSEWLETASLNFTGEFSASGLNYEFDVEDTRSAALWSGIHMVMNREGTASVIPEPATLAFGGLAGLTLLLRRRRAL